MTYDAGVEQPTVNGCGWEVQVWRDKWRNCVFDEGGDYFVFVYRAHAEEILEELLANGTDDCEYRVYESLEDFPGG